jgi:hypothetical protein
MVQEEGGPRAPAPELLQPSMSEVNEIVIHVTNSVLVDLNREQAWALEQLESDSEDVNFVNLRRQNTVAQFHWDSRNLRAFVRDLRYFRGLRDGLGELLTVLYLHY